MRDMSSKRKAQVRVVVIRGGEHNARYCVLREWSLRIRCACVCAGCVECSRMDEMGRVMQEVIDGLKFCTAILGLLMLFCTAAIITFLKDNK